MDLFKHFVGNGGDSNFDCLKNRKSYSLFYHSNNIGSNLFIISNKNETPMLEVSSGLDSVQ